MSPLRVPPATLRPSLALLRRLVLNAGVPIPRQRSRFEAFTRATTLLPRGTRVEDFTIGGVSGLRINAPDVDPERVVVHLHGGAYCVGSPTMAKGYAAHLSRSARAAVLLPDYRLAPEHPYPAALCDVMRLWQGLAEEEPGRRPALVGDSAGAALAVVTAARLRDAGQPPPGALGLICPYLDVSSARSRRPDDPVLTPEWLATCAAAYADGHALDDPELSPLLANLDGLPPTLVVSGARDMLLGDALAFCAAVRAGGGSVEHHEGALWHDFPLQAGLISAADRAVLQLGEFLDRHLG